MNVNIAQWIQRNAEIYPDKTSLKDDRRSLSYRQLQSRILQLAGWLKGHELQRGDRVAFLLPNCVEMIEGLFASAHIGASYVPLNWRLGEDELAYILSDCTPRVLFYAAAWRERVEALRGRLEQPMVLVEVEGDEADARAYESCFGDAIEEPRVGGGDDDLMIIYTSGTTGHPKGVVLTHANVFWHTINGWALGISPDNICLVLLPLFHVGGLNGSVTPVLHVGGTVLLQRTFKPEVVLETLESERVTGVLGVPTIYRMLSEHPRFETTDFSHCEVLLSGGAPLPESLIRLYHERGLEFRQGYGLTEASPGVTGMGPGECLNKAGSAGRCILYTEVQIVDDAGAPLPRGQSGEIVVRGPNVMKGYWKLPEITAKTIRNGWLHTGDIGRFDDEGFLYIVDRKKDMIISGGENIYPAEIEKLLADHPQVQMAAVLGRGDEKWGEVPVAVIVAHDDGLDAEQLKAYLKPKLAKYKLPKAYIFTDAMPLNASGKVVKAALREQFEIRL